MHGKDGLAAKLKLLKYIFRPELTERLSDIIAEIEQTAPALRVREDVETMITYLENSGRADDKVLNRIRAELALTEEDHKTVDRFMDRLAGDRIEIAEQRGIQKGMAEAALTSLKYKLGNVTPAASKKVKRLPVEALKKLSIDLHSFQSKKDLDQWLLQHPSTTEQKNK